jgi:hypothetical protein
VHALDIAARDMIAARRDLVGRVVAAVTHADGQQPPRAPHARDSATRRLRS